MCHIIKLAVPGFGFAFRRSRANFAGPLALFIIFVATWSSHATMTFTTLAGSASTGSSNGFGATVTFSNPQAVATDTGGNIYVADSANNIIRLITPAGNVSTLAGSAGLAGSADGTGPAARFNQPAGIAVDSATNIYVSDYGNHTIRQISTLGVVTTFAGLAGTAGSANNVGSLASFFHPMGLAVDSANNVYVADYGNHLIRKITPARAVSTLAGSAGNFGYTNGTGTATAFYGPEALTMDLAGNVYVADTGNAAVRKVTPAGVVTLVAGSPGSLGSADGTGGVALFFQPAGIILDSATNLFVADYFNNSIRKITPAGVVSTLAGTPGTSGSADGLGSAARFLAPQGLAINAAGLIFIADSGNNAIRAMTASGFVSTLAASASGGSIDGIALSSRFNSPQSVAADASGNLYVADAQNSTIRKITLTGSVSVLAGTTGMAGSADGSGTNALFASPQGVAVDGAGNVFVADTGNATIRKITSAGLVTTIAGAAGNPGNADGVGTNSQFFAPTGVAVDNANNIYVADTFNHTIRRIAPGGVVSTLAGSAGTFGSADGATINARFNCPAGIAVQAGGNIFVTDFNNHTLRQVTPSGAVTTLAGWAGMWGSADGANNGASFFGPSSLSVDASTNIYVADLGNNIIRKVSPSGTNWIVSTIGGNAASSGSADGPSALFYNPSGISVNNNGYLFVADSGNNAIRTSEAVAALTWTTPSPITYGTALGGSQLSASANVPGTFAYNPLSGTILNAGTNLLSVFFTPTDTANYRGASAKVNQVVSPAALTVAANNARRAAGLPNPPFSGTISGLQNSDSITATYNSAANPASLAGQYPITPALVDPGNRHTNYNVTLVNGILTVVVPPAFQSEFKSAGNHITFTWSAVSNQMYQIQYCTNLIQPTWLNLGALVTATNSVATKSDTLSLPACFYRLTLYP
jgi:sugar lactone lactonase YvrE